jgi:hypothetical protein
MKIVRPHISSRWTGLFPLLSMADRSFAGEGTKSNILKRRKAGHQEPPEHDNMLDAESYLL